MAIVNASTRIRVLAVVLLLVAIAVQITHQYRSARQGLGGGAVGLPPGGVADNDTHNTVPGNPAATISDAHRLFLNIQVYRGLHGGHYPTGAGALWADLVNNYRRYGYKTQAEAGSAFENADGIYADAAIYRNHRTWPFAISGTRADGSAVGSAKAAGTRDVVAYCPIYFHMNRRHFNGFKDTINPIGFFIVIWDDGKIQKMPYTDLLFAKQPNSNSYVWTFKGQAGLTPGTKTFDQVYGNDPRGA